MLFIVAAVATWLYLLSPDGGTGKKAAQTIGVWSLLGACGLLCVQAVVSIVRGR